MKIPSSSSFYKYYSYTVYWYQPDKEYIGICSQFHRSLSFMHKDSSKALTGIRSLIKFVVKEKESKNEKIPIPNSLVKKSLCAIFVVLLRLITIFHLVHNAEDNLESLIMIYQLIWLFLYLE